MQRFGLAATVGGFLLALLSAAAANQPLRIPETELEPVAFSQLAGWEAEDYRAALAAFRKSCAAVIAVAEGRNAKRARRLARPIDGPLSEACAVAAEMRGPVGVLSARRFF